MKTRRTSWIHLLGATLLACSGARLGLAQLNNGEEPKEMAGAKVVEKLNAKLPLDLHFTDDRGQEVALSDYFNKGKPVLITLNYFACPSLCTLQLNGLLDIMREQAYVPGQQFELLTISFEPLDTVEIAAAKKANYIREYGKSEAAKGWHFLTGKPEAIKALTQSVGFYYVWNPERQEWIHKAATIVCTPDGRVSRYLGGVAFSPETMRLSIVESSGGKVGSLWDQVFLSCFHYIPSEGRYVPIVQNIMKLAAAVTVAVMAVLIFGLFRAEKRRRRKLILAAGLAAEKGS